MSINNPSSWKFLAGRGSIYGGCTPEQTAQKVIALGANGVYFPDYLDTWNTTSWRAILMRYATEIRRLGGLVYIQQYPMIAWQMDSNWDVESLNQREVINNLVVNGVNQQDEYINWVKTAVTDLQPDICQIMNEVRGDGYPYDNATNTTAGFWVNYINFCNRFMSEMNAIKPNMVYTVSGIPFWNLTAIATHTADFIIPSGCKLFYSYHYYYAFGGTRPSNSDPANQAYWDGNLALGKQLTYDNWLNKVSMNSLLSQGKQILFDEGGTNIINPNFATYMKDFIDFCVAHNLGFVQLDNAGTYCYRSDGTIISGITDATACANAGGAWRYNTTPAGFWGMYDYNLNALGQSWKQIIDGLAKKYTFAHWQDGNVNPIRSVIL